MTMVEIVKDNIARFSFYREGELYYEVLDGKSGNKICMFPVNVEDKRDIGNASFNVQHKAITLMRYIRKAMDKEELIMFK